MPRHRAARVRCTISPDLCSRNQVAQCSPLVNLPAELQHFVWNNLTTDADRSCLALTCKANAAFYNSIKSLPARQPPPEQRLTFLLRLQDFSAHRQLRLCFKCRKFKKVRSGWAGMTAYLRSRVVTQAIRIKGPNCPSCTRESRAAAKQIGRKMKAQ